jgi:fatty acid desaturase
MIFFARWIYVPILYTLGSLNAFQCQMLGHEAAHGLIFPNRSSWNKLFCIIGFMPTFVAPFAGYWYTHTHTLSLSLSLSLSLLPLVF